MSARKKKGRRRSGGSRKKRRRRRQTSNRQPQRLYSRASDLASRGDLQAARSLYTELNGLDLDARFRALVRNDLGVLETCAGNHDTARQHFETALQADPNCGPAAENLERLTANSSANEAAPASEVAARRPQSGHVDNSVKVAVLSFLFNWPSTGGGIVHTVDLVRFLGEAGYEVKLFHPRYGAWSIGQVDASCPVPVETLDFDGQQWTIDGIKSRFRAAVDAFAPQAVIITDSWNFKPHLAEAMRGYPYLMRMQAQECLCPLNNLRMQPREDGGIDWCPNAQPRTPEECLRCLKRWNRHSGDLHRLERSLSEVWSPGYRDLLYRTFREARAVLTLNRPTAELWRPWAADVRVVTWGMDPARFPQPSLTDGESDAGERPVRLFFAGLTDEPTKGFVVLHEACARLWRHRRDFELVATGDPSEHGEEFVRFVGWQSQADLPTWYRETDVCVVPSVAREGLSRTAVEAMAAVRPVIGSRTDGLAEAVVESETGLLCEPGNAEDLVEKIEFLLDRPEWRSRLGRAGRKRFETRFAWPVVIERDYRPLLDGCHARNGEHSPGHVVSESRTEKREEQEAPSNEDPSSLLTPPFSSSAGSRPSVLCPRLAQAFEHAASSPDQMSPAQYFRIAVEILSRSPCNVLIFGVGRDTELFTLANPRGRTVVLEHNEKWLSRSRRLPCETIPVSYVTRIDRGLLDPCPVPGGVPQWVRETAWDVIVVDGPEGYTRRSPGRQQSIHLASQVARAGTTVFLHDAQRRWERLCAARYLAEPAEWLGHKPALAVHIDCQTDTEAFCEHSESGRHLQ